MNPKQFLATVQDVIVGTVDFTVGGRGHGSIRFVTRDDHAAHALIIRAQRAGLTVKRTETDDQTHVLRVTGFRFVPTGPLHTCSTPGSARPCAACGGVR